MDKPILYKIEFIDCNCNCNCNCKNMTNSKETYYFGNDWGLFIEIDKTSNTNKKSSMNNYSTRYNKRVVSDLYAICEEYDIELGLSKKKEERERKENEGEKKEKNEKHEENDTCFYLTIRLLSTFIISYMFVYILLYTV